MKNNNQPVKYENKVHSPIRWFGGKFFYARDLIALMPKHHCYVEPFGGGGHVLTKKERSKVEVWNDIDADLINFLMELRNNREELVESLHTLPTSRHLTEKWLKEELPVDPLERAVRWYYLLRQTIIPANNVKSGWRAGKVKSTAYDYQNSIERLNHFEKRIRNVMIECMDYKDLIEKYDSESTLFFIDPPYVGRESMYKGGFSEKDHIELAEMLHNIKGKALVSYYPDPLILELYKDWRHHTIDAFAGTYSKTTKTQQKLERTELFMMNYDADHNGLFSSEANQNSKSDLSSIVDGVEEQLSLF